MLVNNLGEVSPGATVRCVRWAGSTFKTGATYTIAGGCPDYPRGYMVAEGGTREGAVYGGLWEIIAQPAMVPVTLAFGVSSLKPQRDQAEARLMAIWKDVPRGCCAKCAAPLPCDYHPVEEEIPW